MALVYSMKPTGKYPDERDMELMFKLGAPFRINCASGPFRIFITKLVKRENEYHYEGTVADCPVEGFYNPKEKKGTIVFGQSKKSTVLV